MTKLMERLMQKDEDDIATLNTNIVRLSEALDVILYEIIKKNEEDESFYDRFAKSTNTLGQDDPIIDRKFYIRFAKSTSKSACDDSITDVLVEKLQKAATELAKEEIEALKLSSKDLKSDLLY